MENQIELLKEQIKSVRSGEEQKQGRLSPIGEDILERRETRKRFTEEQKQLDAQLKEVSSCLQGGGGKAEESCAAQIDGLNQTAEQSKNEIISLLNERASTKGRLQRYDAMQEQAQLRKSELTQKLLEARTSEETQRAVL